VIAFPRFTFWDPPPYREELMSHATVERRQRMLHARRFRSLAALLAVIAIGALSIGSSFATAATPGTLVPKSTVPGAGAFMGPVRTVPTNGIKIGYRQFGHGPDLLMITGDTAPMTLWMPYLLKPLAQHFTVTIFDNRGVGYSTDDLSKPMTVPLMAEDTAGLIEALGLEKPTVVGWSMGGETGITLAEQNPELVGALVTSGGNPGSSHAVQPAGGLLKELAHPPSPTFLLHALFPNNAAGGKAAEQFGEAYETLKQENVSQKTLDRQEKAEYAFARYPKVFEGLATIKVPYLITNGQLDRLNPVANAHLLHEQIPGSKLAIYKNAGHGMMFQDTARFVAEVVKFAG
jgi:pimeloyl-ACP methyl ester carboxylesterase